MAPAKDAWPGGGKRLDCGTLAQEGISEAVVDSILVAAPDESTCRYLDPEIDRPSVLVPCASMWWVPGSIPGGKFTVVEKLPPGPTVVVPRRKEVECQVIVTVEPGWSPVPETITDCPETRCPIDKSKLMFTREICDAGEVLRVVLAVPEVRDGTVVTGGLEVTGTEVVVVGATVVVTGDDTASCTGPPVEERNGPKPENTPVIEWTPAVRDVDKVADPLVTGDNPSAVEPS